MGHGLHHLPDIIVDCIQCKTPKVDCQTGHLLGEIIRGMSVGNLGLEFCWS